MPIDSLAVVKELRAVFARRGAHNHCGIERLKRIECTDGIGPNTYLVYDPVLSRKLLCSSAVTNQNYFMDAFRHLESQGRPLPLNKKFFAESPLFQEGVDHREIRRAMSPLVDQICAFICSQMPRIERYFLSRHSNRWTPVGLAQRVVEVCFSLAIKELTGASLLVARRAIRTRASVFYFHFNSARHVKLEEALCLLNIDISKSVDDSNEQERRNKVLLAQSLIIMGVDPTIATICDAIMNDSDKEFNRASNRCCPVSFISRTCVEQIEIESIKINVGDVLYLSLVRGQQEQCNEGSFAPGPPISFGAGLHVCLGKPVAMAVIGAAQSIFNRLGVSVKNVPAMARGDGAFLHFVEPDST